MVGGDTPTTSPTGLPEVKYAYEFHVVEVANKVRDVVEAQMRAYLRDEDEQPGDTSGPLAENAATADEKNKPRLEATGKKNNIARLMYMPSWHMEKLLGSLADALKMPHWKMGRGPMETTSGPAVTLFILNPRRAWALPHGASSVGNGQISYGYRCGLSPSAMVALAADPEVVQRAEKMERTERMRWRVIHTSGGRRNSHFLRTEVCA